MNTSLVKASAADRFNHRDHKDHRKASGPQRSLCCSHLRGSQGAKLPWFRRPSLRKFRLAKPVIPAVPQSMGDEFPACRTPWWPEKATRFALIDHTVRSAEKKPVECEFTSRKQIRQLPRANPSQCFLRTPMSHFVPSPRTPHFSTSVPQPMRESESPAPGSMPSKNIAYMGNWRRPHTQTWSICPDQNHHNPPPDSNAESAC
jgi:hypothetical protein